jgi:hypothetical protein
VTITPPLPFILHAQLTRLRRRIRLIRFGLGVAAFLIVASGLMLSVWGIDNAFGLPVIGLRAANLGLAAAVGACALVTLVACLKPISRTRLAALVEEKFPELGERLASTVELHAAGAQGAAGLLQHLDEETARIAAPIDFRQARPLAATGRWACRSSRGTTMSARGARRS